MNQWIGVVVAAGLLPVAGLYAAGQANKPDFHVYTDPSHVDEDFRFQGEYSGTVSQDGRTVKFGAQVRALGNGTFRSMFFAGGLPGDGWDGGTIIQKAPTTDSAKPPTGALVLFDGGSLDAWQKGAAMTPQKWLSSATGATSVRKFQDFALHLEFMISYMPETTSIYQRPNSGVYLQRRAGR